MDTLPDFETFDIFVFHSNELNPDLDRIEAALQRSERVVTGLASTFPKNAVFADHLATTRRALALLPAARAARARRDSSGLDEIAGQLARLFSTQGKTDRLAEWGLRAG